MAVGWSVVTGDCREVLRTLDAGSVQTCVTSPPYFGLRDYGHGDQIGLEPTPDEFVAALVAVFREVRRVLRDDGTVWLNLGDSYAATTSNNGGYSEKSTLAGFSRPDTKGRQANETGERRTLDPGCKPKDLIGIPWMVAFALRADGWFLRSDIIWHKPNPMPESVTDRPTKAHEYLFLLSKQARYFYDADAVAEAAEQPVGVAALTGQIKAAELGHTASRSSTLGTNSGATTRNKRDVWTVPSAPFSGAHFATFPPKLIEPCVLAGAPERACSACGEPWQRQVERTPMVVTPGPGADQMRDELGGLARTQTGGTMTQAPTATTTGFAPGCKCEAPPTGGIVLDPFNGAGTTGLVALRHNRSYIGIELNPDYAEMARQRIRDDAPLLNTPLEVAA